MSEMNWDNFSQERTREERIRSASLRIQELYQEKDRLEAEDKVANQGRIREIEGQIADLIDTMPSDEEA